MSHLNVDPSIQAYLDRAESTDAYWVEKAQINAAVDLADLMEKSQVTQAEFARRLGSSPAYVSKILRGDVNFTLKSLVTLARTLGGRLHLKIASAHEDYELVKAPVMVVKRSQPATAVFAQYGTKDDNGWVASTHLVHAIRSNQFVCQNDSHVSQYPFTRAA